MITSTNNAKCRLNNCNRVWLFLFLLAFISSTLVSYGQDAAISSGTNDSKLLDSFIDSQGYINPIIFDAKNIKQFWTQNSVFGKDDSIHVILNNQQGKWVSNRHGIMLANVDESMNCKIDVITTCEDLTYSVLDSNSNILGKSSNEQKFIQYYVLSTVLPLELTRTWNGNNKDYSFNLEFQTNNSETITIKKIILSFSKNSNRVFLKTQGRLSATNDLIEDSKEYTIKNDMEISGRNSIITLSKNIIVEDQTIESKATIKNIGEGNVRVVLGYNVYSKDGDRIDSRAYPYKNNNKILNVISAKEGSTEILVDSFTEWERYCFLAINASEDASDLPNFSWVASRVVDYIKSEDNNYIIKLDKPLKQGLDKGTKIRVHGIGSKYLFGGNSKIIKPGEEEIFSLSLALDNESIQATSKCFPKGTCFVKPAILLRAVDSTKENNIKIIDYSISY